MLSLMVGSDAFNLITIEGIGGFHLRDWSCVSCLRLYQPDDKWRIREIVQSVWWPTFVRSKWDLVSYIVGTIFWDKQNY